ncbi:centrosomal protein of 126 kDa isoform X2 [Petaurus breviceps papuanus]|uniref:centrosomal protein of 126 kDa isoform X2 n=1 Tax=Petaurus breviceps papuanus TaxID=3040969 RepID=UPI0036DA2C4A
MLTGRPGARSPARGPGTAPASPVPYWRSNFTRGNNVYQNMKIHLEKNLEEERQKLLQEQRICRSRARKYCIESNRRRKAFEEKRKKEEEKEHQIREQILQQRKQKLEEVTEKFQRAHIPPQRRRTVYQKPVPRLEEALEQIQGFNLKQESNFYSSNRPTINWKTIDSAVTSAVTRIEPMYQKHLSSRINCDKEIQENSKTSWAIGQEDNFQLNLEETQNLLEELHLSNVQDLHEEVNQLTNSETLSSIDSLEAGDHEEIYSTLSRALSSANHQNSVSHNSQSPQPTNQVYFDAGELHLSKTQHINNWLINLSDQNTQTASPFPDFINKHNDHFNDTKLRSFALNRIGERSTDASDSTVAIIQSPCTFAQDKKTEKTSETFSIWKVDSLSSRTLKRERPLVAESPTFRFSKTWTTSSPTTREIVQSSEHEKCPELTQPNRTTSVPASNIPMATPVVLPSSQWTNYKSTYSNIHSISSLQKNNMHLEEICPIQCTDGLDSLKNIKDEKMKNIGSSNQALPFLFPDALSAFMCNTPDPMSMKDKNEKTVGTTPSRCNNSDLVEQPKRSKHNNHERNGVKLLKSILKKESKYENDYFKALIIKQGFTLGSQTAAAIRDSVELTKVKGKGSEMQKSIKKLRWFDEIGQIEKEDGETSLKTGLASSQASSQPAYVQTKVSASSNISIQASAINSASYENHKGILGVMKYENPKDNSLITKNAATQMSETDNVPLDSFVPSGKSFAKQAWITSKKEEGKFPVQNNDSKTQKTVPRSGIIKIIQRSKASKVQSSIATKNKKGTVIRPRPTNEANKTIPTQGKLIAPHPPHKSITNNRISKTVKDSQCQQVMPTKSQSSTINSRNLGSRHVFPTENIFSHITQESSPAPWNTSSSELVTPMPSLPSYLTSERQISSEIKHNVKGTQMIAQQDGSLICAQRSPLYEENSHSLKHIEEKVGIQWKGECSALGQNEKAADSTSARRKVNLESNENKPRTLLEQRRHISNSMRQRCFEQPQNIIQPIQLSSVSESTAQFLMAEKLVKSSVPEDKILNAMKPMQPYKPTLPLHKTQQLNIGTLSFEEQKIIESLNHLNQRLHYVQEAICKNPSIKSILQIASPLADSGLMMVPAMSMNIIVALLSFVFPETGTVKDLRWTGHNFSVEW